MDKFAKILLNWKVLLPLIILLVIALWAGPTLLRKVKSYQPPAERDFSGWGTLDRETATRLQSMLDADVNRQGVPGFQVSIQTSDVLTWYGVSGTTDPERKIPLRRDHILRVGSATKTFTSVIILQLVEDGKLGLVTRSRSGFPIFPLPRIHPCDKCSAIAAAFMKFWKILPCASGYFSHRRSGGRMNW